MNALFSRTSRGGVDAVIAGIQLSADEPFPKGRLAGVSSVNCAPNTDPSAEFGVFAKTLRKFFSLKRSTMAGSFG